MEDYLPEIRPSNFNGLFVAASAGLELGGLGAGCAAYQIGSEWTPAVTKPGERCGFGGGGLDLGAGLMFGKSTLVGLTWAKCDTCDAIDSPFLGFSQ